MTVVKRAGPNGQAPPPLPTAKPKSGPTRFGESIKQPERDVFKVLFAVDEGRMGEIVFHRSDSWQKEHRGAINRFVNAKDHPSEAAGWRVIRVFSESDDGRRLEIAFWETVDWVRVLAVTQGEAISVKLPGQPTGWDYCGKGRVVGVDASTGVPGRDGPWILFSYMGALPKDASKARRRIDEFEVGEYVATYAQDNPQGGVESEPVIRYRVGLRYVRDNGGEVAIVLLRNRDWLSANRAEAGGRVELTMPEMSVWGESEVLSVEPCLVSIRGDGRGMVTGTFRHSSGDVGELRVWGESKPIGVTSGHLFWSVDREKWIPVGELEPGETVKILSGTAMVESYTPGVSVQPVCNLEVEGDHCYRVGEQGVLVHNASTPPAPSNCLCPNAKRETATVGEFTVDREVVKKGDMTLQLRSGQNAICRIWSISGPINKTVRPTSRTPESAMIDLLYANNTTFQGKYQAGHVIAATLVGPHSTENLVPMTEDFNTSGAWRSFEIQVGKCRSNCDVQSGTMTVKMSYDNSGAARYVPTTITASVNFVDKKGKMGGPKPIVFRNRGGDVRNFRDKCCFNDWE